MSKISFMDSAPKDGTIILGWDGSEWRPFYFNLFWRWIEDFSQGNGHYVDDNGQEHPDTIVPNSWVDEAREPICWMNMPSFTPVLSEKPE